ncbi:hypothetical protein NOF04DRAFT_1337152 [Fusarium oxysporum II5]|nr:hypothetical protein NOF04DRAFT_1337152 [Fusarium oxysporum II5]
MSCHGAGCTSFTNQCVAIIQGLSSPIPGLVDKSGFPISKHLQLRHICGAMTSYFLPWLASPLNYPSRTRGPPCLITYSLALTLFNRSWAVDTVRRILNRSRRYNREAAAEIRLIEDRLKSFSLLAVEGQQVPLRATVAHHWLSSLIVSPVNQAWWTALRDHITNSRRRPSLSFHVQVGLAGCGLGAINTAIHLATSTLWVWLIPVTWGWIWAGTHSTGCDGYHALPASEDFAESPTQDGVQIGIWVDVESGLTLEPRQQRRNKQEGPVYNYARSVLPDATCWIYNELSSRLSRDLHWWFNSSWNRKPDINLLRPTCQLPRYSTNQSTHPGQSVHQLLRNGCRRLQKILEALIVALFTQWGTTGAAIIMAYYTPMIGFGCRSGSYLLYGILSTVVLFILILSMALSHQAMRMYQAEHIRPPTTNFSKRWTVTWTHWLFCFDCCLEFVGLFDNCWCKSCHLQFGDNGYAVLFRSNEDYQKIAEGSWIGGLSMATIVTSILCLIFFFSTRKG